MRYNIIQTYNNMDCLYTVQSKIKPIKGIREIINFEEEEQQKEEVKNEMDEITYVKIERQDVKLNNRVLKNELSNSKLDENKSIKSSASSSTNSLFKRLSLKPSRRRSEIDANDLLHFNIINKIKNCILLDNEDIETLISFNMTQLKEIICEFDALIIKLNKKYEIFANENSNTANLNHYGDFDNKQKQEDKILYKIHNLINLSETNYNFLKSIKDTNYMIFYIITYKETFNMIAPYKFKNEIQSVI